MTHPTTDLLTESAVASLHRSPPPISKCPVATAPCPHQAPQSAPPDPLAARSLEALLLIAIEKTSLQTGPPQSRKNVEVVEVWRVAERHDLPTDVDPLEALVAVLQAMAEHPCASEGAAQALWSQLFSHRRRVVRSGRVDYPSRSFLAAVKSPEERI